MPCCVRDEGRSLGIGLQDRVPNHRKLRGAKVLVVSVPEKAGRELVRCEPRRRTQVNRRGGVESVGTSSKPGTVVSLGRVEARPAYGLDGDRHKGGVSLA
jgi:hypothetical protein